MVGNEEAWDVQAYVQFVEYISFVKCMDALRGMKLVQVREGKATAAAIRVDFDRTKQLADKTIRRRRLEREKLAELERLRKIKEEEERSAGLLWTAGTATPSASFARVKLESERAKLDDAAFQRRRAREEKRRIRAAEKKRRRVRIEERLW